MGITGLLPLLKTIHKPCNLKKFAGLTIGVDAYGWLHRGTVGCAIDLALGKPTTKFVDFAMSRVNMLLHFGVTPYIVFDGDYLPSKAATELDRDKRRAESKRVGLELYRMGKPHEAHAELQKAVDVTPEMARQFIEELKLQKVDYIVAPYEADAQLVYLERHGIIQGILSEDSDMLVFGSKLLLTKLDQYGDCVTISRDDFTACRDANLAGWSDAEFRQMAILSGCDYLPNISKMGLKTAHRMIRKHGNIDKILRMLQFEGQYRVPPGYLEDFRKAELTFLHQRVFCPRENKLVMLTGMSDEPEPKDFDFIGRDIEASVAIGVAAGDLNPMTKQPIVFTARVRTSAKPKKDVSRRQSEVSMNTPTCGKTIDEFFKAKRTPLAELNPNNLRPSPSQRRLLSQQGREWLSSPAPESPLMSRVGTTELPPRYSSNILSINGVLTGRAQASNSVSHPLKRQRLCDDPYDDLPESQSCAKIETGSSRFFTPSVPEPSPSLKRPSRTKKKASEINVWSDDSIEDAMAGLPDVSNDDSGSIMCAGTTVAKKVSVFREGTSSVAKAKDDTMEANGTSQISQSSTSRSVLSEDSDKSSIGTPRSSMTSLATSQPLAQRLDSHVQEELAVLSTKFSYKPAVSTTSKILKPVAGPVVTKPVSARSPAELQSINTTRTPLQRLQAGALHRSRSLDNGLMSLSSVPQWTELQKRTRVRQHVASPSLEDVLRPMTGSEDCLVPNSDDDDDNDQLSLSGAEHAGDSTRTIDLEKFRCPG